MCGGAHLRADDLILVSVDDHVIEPPHMFEGRLPAKHVAGAPGLIRRDDGTMPWRTSRYKITHLNAMSHFRHDPFSRIAREETTAAALRRRAVGWDISGQATRHLRPQVAG
jgi:hypothetical protein